MHRHPAALLVAPFEQRRLDHPAERPGVLGDEVEPDGEVAPKAVEGHVGPVGAVGDDAHQVAFGGPGRRHDAGDLLWAQELLHRRPDRAAGFDDEPHEAGGPTALRLFDQLVELLARERPRARRRQGLDRAPVGQHLRERVEPRPGEHRPEIHQLHAVAQVRLVRSVPLHHLGVGHARERLGHLDPRDVLHDPRVQRFDQGDQVLFGDEAHLHVELGELEPSVGARGLVAEAAHDLVVPVLAAHHQHLLQLLRRLRQRVERARLQAARHQEVARTLRGAARQQGGLDLDEPQPVHVLPHQLHDAGPHRQHLRHLGPAQVEVAVREPEVLAHLDAVLDRERRRLGRVQHLELGRGDLDLTGGEVGVLHAVGTGAHRAGHPDDVLAPQLLGTRCAPRERPRDGTRPAPRRGGREGR